MSQTRKIYFARLTGRCLVFVACAAAYLFRREMFGILDGMRFFEALSPLHLLWGIWMADMLLQIIPVKSRVALGSQKLFASRFVPARQPGSREELGRYIRFANRRALVVFLLVPLIAGVSYEFIRLAGTRDTGWVNALSKPGLWLQKLTTKEPDETMVQVAIMAVEAVFDWRNFLAENF